MRNNRLDLVHLIAIGRLSPAEAERLILAWNEGRETVWALSACVLIACLTELNSQHWLPALLQNMNTLLAGSLILAHHAVSLLNDVGGGIL